MQIFWIFIQTSQILSNFAGGYWLYYLKSLHRYLTFMLVLSAIGILMFIPLSQMGNNIEICNQSMITNTGDQNELSATHIRAGSHYIGTKIFPLRSTTYEASESNLERVEEEPKSSFFDVIYFFITLANIY